MPIFLILILMSYKPGSLFSFPMQPLASGKYFKGIPDMSRGIDEFLFPKNLDTLMPLQMQFADFDSDDDENDNNDQLSLDEKIKKFEKQRDQMFQDYFTFKQQIQKITLQASKQIEQNDPDETINISYQRLLRAAEEKAQKQQQLPETESSTNKAQFVSLSSETKDTASESLSSSRPRSRRKKQPILLNDKDMDLEINTSWIQAASLEADEEYLAWLQDLPNTPTANTSKTSNHKAANGDENELIDPLEEARRTALANQNEREEEDRLLFEQAPKSEEVRPKETPPKPTPVQRIPSAAELNADWGFTDQEIGMSIRKFIRGMQGGLTPDKKKK